MEKLMLLVESGGYGIFADLNTVQIYRNRIYLGGRQPENERKYHICRFCRRARTSKNYDNAVSEDAAV